MTCLFKLQSQVGEGRCFSVNCSEKAKEQALQVLKHFNVQVTLEDIFSRCQVGQVLSKLKAMLTHHPFTAGTASTPNPCWGFALSAMCLVPKISAWTLATIVQSCEEFWACLHPSEVLMTKSEALHLELAKSSTVFWVLILGVCFGISCHSYILFVLVFSV